ncbi:hypothetical protein [Spiroplasma poulsonii]|nr:hypothetical protein [Spiroplasma poulsonii]KAF0850643.1 Putrescine carbamoyltransferase [Spiroplasma poulsonii]PWF96683.1 hypothetical protein SMSE_21300 [Spiroplasma poulsonii]
MERKHYFILRSLVTKYGKDNILLALLVKKLQIFVKKILIEKYNFN